MSKVPRDGECWDDTYNFYSVRADGTQRAATLLFLERLLGLWNSLARPSVWGISLQSSQRGFGPDSALVLVQVQPETVALLCWKPHGRGKQSQTHVVRSAWCFAPFWWCSLSKRHAYSSKAPCWGHASIAWPWSAQICAGLRWEGLCSHQNSRPLQENGSFLKLFTCPSIFLW